MIRNLFIIIAMPTILVGMEYSSNNNVASYTSASAFDSYLQQLIYFQRHFINTLKHNLVLLRNTKTGLVAHPLMNFYNEEIQKADAFYNHYLNHCGIARDHYAPRHIQSYENIMELVELHANALTHTVNLLENAISCHNSLTRGSRSLVVALTLGKFFEKQTIAAKGMYALVLDDHNTLNHLQVLEDKLTSINQEYKKLCQPSEDASAFGKEKNSSC